MGEKLRVILVNEPVAYREALAEVLREVCPHLEVLLVEPEALELGAVGPDRDLVVCSHLHPERAGPRLRLGRALTRRRAAGDHQHRRKPLDGRRHEASGNSGDSGRGRAAPTAASAVEKTMAPRFRICVLPYEEDRQGKPVCE